MSVLHFLAGIIRVIDSSDDREEKEARPNLARFLGNNNRFCLHLIGTIKVSHIYCTCQNITHVLYMYFYLSEGIIRSRREKGVVEDLGALLLPIGALVPEALGDLGALVSGMVQVNP